MHSRHVVSIIIALSTSILGCNKENVINVPASTEITLVQIEVSVPTTTFITELQFQASGRYSNGTVVDITSDVQWETSNSAIATIDSAGKLVPLEAGVTDVTASIGDNTGQSSGINVIDSVVCGHSYGNSYSTAVNDTDNSNAIGACVKIAQDNNGNWFTATPSYTAVKALGYKYLDASYLENGSYGPNGGMFIRFNWFSIAEWCSHLSSLEFANRSNWTMPSLSQLTGLYTDRGNMFANHGWPTYYYYQSLTQSGQEYSDISLNTGTSSTLNTIGYDYGSCVSES
ncbi:Ig-like domain-containing protein [Enterovibrio makurazakiensis]|uniref:adhesion domain-containing protein n=1 Tax=Enterovibrio makurazakiensis TaxID=2910232 RepID=UPI003D1F6311